MTAVLCFKNQVKLSNGDLQDFGDVAATLLLVFSELSDDLSEIF